MPRPTHPPHRILIVHREEGELRSAARFFGRELELVWAGCGGSLDRARSLIARHAPEVSAIALERMPLTLELGHHRRRHAVAPGLAAAAGDVPLVDGNGIRSALERWAVAQAARSEPGIFSDRRVLMLPGLNHAGLAEALARHSPALRYADPEIFFGLPDVPGVGSRRSLEPLAEPTLERLHRLAYAHLAPLAGDPPAPLRGSAARRARLLAGDVETVLRYAPADLNGRTVVVEAAGEAELAELRRRGVAIAVILTPQPPEGTLRPWTAATVEAALAALRSDPALPLGEDTYLDLMAEMDWAPAIRYLQPGEEAVRRFAFVIHPLSVEYIRRHPTYRWTRHLPARLVEWFAARTPPMYLSRITGGRSPATGQRIEGYLFSLGATPRAMMRRPPRATYDQLHRVARMAAARGARILGLGAFTSVVGDAGETVAHEADIAVTSGNSLTVAATLEAAKQAVRRMGNEDLSRGRAMVVGATGSIGSVCARLLAQAVRDVVLVSIEPERLIELKRTILAETPGARVTIATRPDELLGSCELVVTATSAFGQRILDISRARPGAVICDVARPPDIGPAEAALRPDVLVVESGEVVIPGPVDFGYDIGLPAGISYACLAETALLAMEGRFEDYTLGRRIDIDRVKEIYRLFHRHGFHIAGLRSHGVLIGEEEIAAKRAAARRLADDPELRARVQTDVAARLATLPAGSKGVEAAATPPAAAWWTVAAAAVAVAALAVRRRQRARRPPP